MQLLIYGILHFVVRDCAAEGIKDFTQKAVFQAETCALLSALKDSSKALLASLS
jgi:hypothetical protein